MKKIVIAILLVLITVTLNFKAEEMPNIVYVDDDFNESTVGWNITHFNKIQDGINAVGENGIVYVYDGIYNESIVINKTISLIGKNIPLVREINVEKAAEIKNFEIRKGGININASNCQVENCKIYDCNKGISITSNNSTIKNCIIQNNTYGIYIKGNSNLIYSNNFIENNINAYEEGENIWYNDNTGNYWYDYDGTDENGDGIGDIPYEINGNFDDYPLISPIDLYPPSINLRINGTLGNNGWYISDVNVTLSATDGYINYSIDGIWYESNESLVEFLLGEGIHEIKYYAIDEKENKGRIEEVEIKIDKTPPSISYFLNPSSPNGNNGWYVSNVEIYLSASDENGIDELNYKIDKGGWEDYTGFFLIQAEGLHNIYFRAIDIAGNEKIENVSLKIDKTPPYVSFNMDKIIKGEYEIKWDAYDEISNLTNISILYSPDGQEWQEVASFNGSVTSYKWRTYNYTDSKNAFLKIIVQDSAGNIGNETSQFVLDNSPPFVKINEPKEGKYFGKDEYGNIIIEIEWEAYDEIDENLDGNITIEYYDGEWNVLVKNYSNTGRYTFNAKDWEDGVYNIRVKAKDDAGNVGIAESGNITIDKQPPSIYISKPMEGYLYINLFGREILPPIPVPEIYDVIVVGKITVEVVATDAHSGIQRVELKADNSSYVAYQPPYKWEWNPSLGVHSLKAIAYDNAGNSKACEIEKVLCINL